MGKGGKGGRSIDRSFNRTERQRSGNGSATDRIIQFQCSCSYSMGHRRNTERTPTGHQRDTVAEGLGDARSGARVHTMTEHRKDTDGTLKPQQKKSQRTTAHQGICNASPALQQKNVHVMTPCMLAFPCTQKHAEPLDFGRMVVDHCS